MLDGHMKRTGSITKPTLNKAQLQSAVLHFRRFLIGVVLLILSVALGRLYLSLHSNPNRDDLPILCIFLVLPMTFGGYCVYASFRMAHAVGHRPFWHTEPDNLWAICEDCNAGKKNYFASIDAEWMRKVMGNKSVHVRLGETLKALQPEAVPASTMSFVAGQDDWKKRARELRYLGWNIHVFNRKSPEGKVSSFYQLLHWEPWPEDPTNLIRHFEREGCPQQTKIAARTARCVLLVS